MSWDATTPADNEVASQGASRIRTFKSDLATALSAEGTFPGVDPANPKFYLKLNHGTTAARPAASANYTGRLYFNEDTQTLQRVSDDGASWADLGKNGAYQALHAAGATALTSALGILTLDETSNFFTAAGTEAITSLAGWSAGIVFVRWLTARTLTHNASSLILWRGVNRYVSAGDISLFQFIGASQVRELACFGAGNETLPTYQDFTATGAFTYTTPSTPAPRQLRVKVVAAGGGGGAGTTNSGTAGGDSSFNGVTFKGGSGGGSGSGGNGGAGGTGGTGTARRFPGGDGTSCAYQSNTPGAGGNSMFGGAGGASRSSAGNNGKANTGGGGGGGSNGDGLNAGGGGGGGEGGEFTINNPTPGSTIAGVVGAVGVGGAAGGSKGGDGGLGRVTVEEIY